MEISKKDICAVGNIIGKYFYFTAAVCCLKATIFTTGWTSVAMATLTAVNYEMYQQCKENLEKKYINW